MDDQNGSHAGRTALLTGALGGVGEHVIGELIALGYAVACLDLPSDATASTIWLDLRTTPFDKLAEPVSGARA